MRFSEEDRMIIHMETGSSERSDEPTVDETCLVGAIGARD